ncbi:MAG: tetratricopeptide repeat protein, partial [Planctomycetota bacterium]
YTALATVHVSKLAAGVAVGPAAGPVYMEALKAYDKALELNPDHWDARFSKSFTTSMAPEFIGLRPMSIRMFEDLVQRQDSLPKNDEFRRTYMRLGTLYKDGGNTEKAKQIWKKGLERFPDDKMIQAALAVLEEK